MRRAVQRVMEPVSNRRRVLVRRLGLGVVTLVGTTLTLPALITPAAADDTGGQTTTATTGCPGFSSSQTPDPSQSGGDPSNAWEWSGPSSPGTDTPGADTDGESNGCPELVTTVTPTTVVYGQPVTETASFQTDPQGQVAFFVCSASAANCIPEGTYVGAQSLQADTSGGSSATITYTSPAGSYCFFAVFHNADGTVPESTDESAECFTVTPPPLVITASSGTFTSGGTVPTITPSYSGFVNGETPATAVTTPPTCGTTAVSSSPAGTFPSTCAGAVATNYTITYVPGTVTVLPAPPSNTPSGGSAPAGGTTSATSASGSGPLTTPSSGSPAGAAAVAPATSSPPPATSGATAASASPVSRATAVHTGEPWSGAQPLELDAGGLGAVLVGLGIRHRRRYMAAGHPRSHRRG